MNAPSISPQGGYEFGDIRVEPAAHRVLRNGHELELEPKAYSVLMEFLGHPGEMMPREGLLDSVWGHRHVAPATLSRIIGQLRRKLGDDAAAPHYIQTVHGCGYRFIAAALKGGESTDAGMSHFRFAPPPDTSLPAQLTPLIGREAELTKLDQLIASERLITVVGIGGMGKTQAALACARRNANRFADGVWFFDLASYTDVEQWLPSLASALGVLVPLQAELAAQVQTVLSGRQMLLLLDNCDRIAAPLGDLVSLLLKASGELRVLATSQQRMGLVEECLCLMPPLAVPAEDWASHPDALAVLAEVDAVKLLLMRACACQPDFCLRADNADAIAQLCRRLDGMPLALELAASRLRVLSPEQLLVRMGQQFELLVDESAVHEPRHRALSVLIEWSIGLLSGDEATLLAGLSVFEGGWTAGGAEAIGAALGYDAEHALDLLGGLVDKSLNVADITLNPRRYHLLESVRAHALVLLSESGHEASVRHAHLQHYIDITALAEADMRGPRQYLWVERLLHEQANLRLAFEWAMGLSDGRGKAIQLGANLVFYWRTCGAYRELSQWLTRALTAPLPAVPALARVWYGLGLAEYHQGHTRQAERALCLGLAGCIDIVNDWERGCILALQALNFAGADDLERADSCIEQAMQVAEYNDDGWLRGMIALSRGIVQLHGGHVEAATLTLGEAVSFYDGDEVDSFQIGYCQSALGLAQYLLGNLAAAAHCWLNCMSNFIRLGNQRAIAGCLEGCAYLQVEDGKHASAVRLLGAAAAARERTSAPLFSHWRAAHQWAEQRARSVLAGAFEKYYAEGRRMRFENMAEEACMILNRKIA